MADGAFVVTCAATEPESAWEPVCENLARPGCSRNMGGVPARDADHTTDCSLGHLILVVSSALPVTSFHNSGSNGRIPYEKSTPQYTIMLFIDHQIGLMAGARDFTALTELKSSVVGLARDASAEDSRHGLVVECAMAERRHAPGAQGDLRRRTNLPTE